MRCRLVIYSFTFLCFMTGCHESPGPKKDTEYRIRPLADTVGFAQYAWQMVSLMARLDRRGWSRSDGPPWRMAISPHDDYTYTGVLYPELLQNIKAPTLILLGVAHKAARLGIDDSLVFDSFSHWKAPWQNIKISPAREELFSLLSGRCAVISDTLHAVEHSLEALIPFLQYFNREISIVPILVPAMSPDRMQACGQALARAIQEVADKHMWKWGRDFALIASTDAVHYGNEEWGGADMAPFGCDSTANQKALALEKEIIAKCLTGSVSAANIRRFSDYTLKAGNYKEYRWTWCGRYSVPVALYTALYLNHAEPLEGELVGYSTSISAEPVPVEDIGMGRTAIATPCHWVGYAAIGYR